MNFKIHLLIISAIIIVLYLASSFLASRSSAPKPLTQTPQVSDYYISVVHASWGLNCVSFIKRMSSQNEESLDTSRLDTSKLKTDNVLSAVSNLCNGKDTCEIPLDAASLGGDPAPSCGNKTLMVEYRCFSIDKLRSATASYGALPIDCNAQLK